MCAEIQGLVQNSLPTDDQQKATMVMAGKKRGVSNCSKGVCPPMNCDSATELSLSAEGFLPRNPQPSSANRPKLWVELVFRRLPWLLVG